MAASPLASHSLIRWDHSRRCEVGREPVVLAHRLGELSEFSDEALTDSVDRHPRSELAVYATGDDPAHPTQWQCGDPRDLCGSALLEAVNRGRLWLSASNIQTHHRYHQAVIERACRELATVRSDLGTLGYAGELQFASPLAMERYGFGTALRGYWQLRGSRRFWIYPRRPPLLTQKTVEQAVTGTLKASVYYQPSFESEARMIELRSGQTLVLPPFTPSS